MGIPHSKDVAVEAKQNMEQMEIKRDFFIQMLKLKRGADAEGQERELTGGRTIMRHTAIYTKVSSNPASDIEAGINDFFSAASSSGDKAKGAAIAGAQKLVGGAINAVIGSGSAGGTEVIDFCTLFLNNAFVRVDYCYYQLKVEKSGGGIDDSLTMRCVVSEVAVLPIDKIHPSEMNFLLSQSLSVDPGDFSKLLAIEAGLIQLSLFTGMLVRITDSTEAQYPTAVEIQAYVEIMKTIATASSEISEAFAGLDNGLLKKRPDIVPVEGEKETGADEGGAGGRGADFLSI